MVTYMAKSKLCPHPYRGSAALVYLNPIHNEGSVACSMYACIYMCIYE